MEWHLITCEYPTQTGGVSDYSQQIATGLAAQGDTVHVWCPSYEGQPEKTDGVVVHRELGKMSPADLRRVGRMLDKFPGPRRLLVQWVPHGYGYRSMNLPFCMWLWKRARFSHDQVELVVHEPFLAFGEGTRKQDVAATVHRIMIIVLLRAAHRIWVSIPEWEDLLKPFTLGARKSFSWLPIPNNIPIVDDRRGSMEIRERYSVPNGPLLGHFGAYDVYMKAMMLDLIPRLMSGHNKLSVLFLGKGSLELRNEIIARHPALGQNIHATGFLSTGDTSRHISACDVMLQPYKDGISSRRGSAMAVIAHGISMVTTIEKATERCWVDSQAVEIIDAGDIDKMVQITTTLLADSQRRNSLGAAGRALYHEHFDTSRIITALRQNAPCEV